MPAAQSTRQIALVDRTDATQSDITLGCPLAPVTEQNRPAKYYELTSAGRRALGEEAASWRQYVDMVEAGIIDPAKVARIAVENAESVAGMILTTEAVITDKPKEEQKETAPVA